MGIHSVQRAIPSEYATLKIGDVTGGNYTEIEDDGTVVAYGDATTWKDQLGPLLAQRLESPSSDIIQNLAEGTITFKTSATLVDYVVMNLQINHDWLIGSDIEPHFHWFQTSASIPNWLMQHRWQVNGQAKVADWTSLAWNENLFTYTSGTLNQITDFTAIASPVGAVLSDILQLRFIRDNDNDSGLFADDDPLNAVVDVMSFDIHKQMDTQGSRSEYVK